MMGDTESRLASEARGRIPWRWLPIAAIVSAALSYGLHHALPFDDHGLLLGLFAVGGAALLAVAGGVVARPAERQLPAMIAARPGAVEVRELVKGDQGFAATLHAQALEQGLFASLGFGFMRAYYGTFLSSPHAVALTATVRGVPVGVVVGSVDARAHARWVLRHRGARLAARAVAVLVVRPRVALRFAHTRIARYRRAWSRARSEEPGSRVTGRGAVLSHVAVIPGGRGAGIGTALVDAFLDRLRERSVEQALLVTASGLSGAGAFYRRHGWQFKGSSVGYDEAALDAYAYDLTRAPA